jgi:CBS domain-containing protein
MQFIAQGTDMTAFRLVDPAKDGKDQAAWFGFEVLPFALLGILGGILGSFFIRLNLTVQAFRAGNPTAKANPVRLVAFLSLCTLLISYRNVYLHHGSAYLLDELFQDCSIKKEWQSDISKQLCDGRTWSNMLTLLLVFMIKFALTVVSFGLSVPVGLFVPSLCAGACLGRIVGWGVELLHADFGDVGVFASCEGVEYCVSSGRYALVGAAALMCGITRATVSLTAIMFELTGGIDYVVPVMLTLLCSKWAGEMMGVTHGIYDCLIVQRGHQYIPIDVQITSRVPVAKIMVKHPVFLTVRDETLASIDRLLAKYPYKSFPVVSDSTLRLVDSVVFRYQLHDIVEGARRDGIDFQMPVLFSYREKLAKVNPSLRKFMGARAFNTAVDGGAGARRATRGRTKPKRTSSRSMSVPEGQTVESFPADEEREMDRALTYQDVEDPTTTDSDDVKVPPPAGVMWQRGSGREESDLDSTDLSRGDKHAERKDDDDYVGRVRRRWRPDKPSLAKQGVANARELHQCLCRQCCGMRQMGNYEKPPHLDLTRYVDPHPLVIFPDVLTNRVLQMFQSLGTACVLVIDSTGSLVGLVKKIDLLLHIESLKIYPEFAYGPPITRLRTAAEGEYQPLLSKSRSRDVEPTSDAEYIASANFHGYQKSYNSFADKQV